MQSRIWPNRWCCLILPDCSLYVGQTEISHPTRFPGKISGCPTVSWFEASACEFWKWNWYSVAKDPTRWQWNARVDTKPRGVRVSKRDHSGEQWSEGDGGPEPVRHTEPNTLACTLSKFECWRATTGGASARARQRHVEFVFLGGED